MTRKEKKALKKRQSTRQLMGMTELTDTCIATPHGSLHLFLLSPFNLSVESEEDICGHVLALQNLLRGNEELEMLALDSCQSFQDNQRWYQSRTDAEELPALRELLRHDIGHLNDIRVSTASAREFALAFRLEGNPDLHVLSQLERSIREQGFQVRRADSRDVKRLLAIYYERNASEQYEDVDGERSTATHEA